MSMSLILMTDRTLLFFPWTQFIVIFGLIVLTSSYMYTHQRLVAYF